MKLTLSLCFAVLLASAVQAQILRPEAIRTRTGPVAAEMAGNHRGGRDVQAHRPDHRSGGGYVYRHAPAVLSRGGYGHRNYGWGHAAHGPRSYHYYPRHWSYGYYGYRPGFSIGYYPGYAYDYGAYYPGYGYGSYAANGLFWGGLAGAIIGHNSGEFRHNAWRGAAWGAGAGWLLGTIADANRRAVAYEPAVTPSAPAAAVQAAPAQSQPVTIINNYYNAPATPMTAANGLFGRN